MSATLVITNAVAMYCTRVRLLYVPTNIRIPLWLEIILLL